MIHMFFLGINIPGNIQIIISRIIIVNYVYLVKLRYDNEG